MMTPNAPVAIVDDGREHAAGDGGEVVVEEVLHIRHHVVERQPGKGVFPPPLHRVVFGDGVDDVGDARDQVVDLVDDDRDDREHEPREDREDRRPER